MNSLRFPKQHYVEILSESQTKVVVCLFLFFEISAVLVVLLSL